LILGTASATRRRYAAYTTNSLGERVRGAHMDLAISASVQPLNGRELQLLPELARAGDSRKAYTETELRTDEQHAGLPADELIVDGITFKVLAVERQVAIIPHYKATLMRLGEAR
jgi:hypothetical protein